MGRFDSWFGRKPPSLSQEPMSEAQSVAANWASSQPHLALLQRFLSARDVKNGFPDFWTPAFGMSPQRVIDDMVAHGALEPVPLFEKIEFCYTVPEIKKILSSRSLKVSGKKAELAQRLLEADLKGMEKLCADRIILRCTPAASHAVARWESECAKASETATDNVIAVLRGRDFREAIRIADAYQKNKFEPPVHPGVAAMTIKSEPRSAEGRAKELAAVFTMRPKILDGLRPEEWDGLYLNYAVCQLLGHSATDKCMPGFVGVGAMNAETATRMLSFYIGQQRQLARWRELGIEKVMITGIGGCAACRALMGKTFPLDELPELPFSGCTCDLGCRCFARAVLQLSEGQA